MDKRTKQQSGVMGLRKRKREETLGPALNGVQLYVNRDDHMCLGGGANKLRQLALLPGQALAVGAETGKKKSPLRERAESISLGEIEETSSVCRVAAYRTTLYW